MTSIAGFAAAPGGGAPTRRFSLAIGPGDRDAAIYLADAPQADGLPLPAGAEIELASIAGASWTSHDERSARESVAAQWPQLTSVLAEQAASLLTAPGPEDLARTAIRWRVVTRVTELCAALASEQAAAGDVDARHALPLLRRLRFLLLGVPFRLEPSLARQLSAECLFAEGRDELSRRARAARDDWLQTLLVYQEHPALATRLAEQALEREIDLLLWREAPELGGASGAPPAGGCESVLPRWMCRGAARRALLAIPSPSHPYHAGSVEQMLDDAADPAWWTRRGGEQAADRAFVLMVSRELLLRRFRVASAWRAHWLAGGPGDWRGFLIVPLALLILLMGMSIGLAFWALPIEAFFTVGVALYAIVGLGALVRGGLASDPLCLRLAGSAAIGMAAVLTFTHEWWTAGRAGLAAGVLLVATFGYLIVEARAHGAEGPGETDDDGPRRLLWLFRLTTAPAVRRALVVLALGWAHAVAVGSIALYAMGSVLIQPEFYRRNPTTDSPTGESSPSPWLLFESTGPAIVLAGAVGLAVGVFLQILWEDRPVTYPLAHLEWRRRG